MGTISITVPSAGEPRTAASVANPLNTIKNEINGNLDNNNIKAGANIAYSKLALTGGIVNADINAAAAISWTKLSKSGSVLSDIADVTFGSLGAGAIVYRTGGAWVNLVKGTNGQILTLAAGLPSWAASPSVPAGIITMWHGLIANIPSGWVICDGNNDTPNLLGRFVEGVASAVTDPGTTGGATAKTTDATANFSNSGGGSSQEDSKGHTHPISDIRPKFYDVAFIMKS